MIHRIVGDKRTTDTMDYNRNCQCKYARMHEPLFTHRTTLMIKKFKIVAFVLAFLLLFCLLNLQTITYVVKEFYYHENFNIKLCYHFNDDDSSNEIKTIPKIIHQIHIRPPEEEVDLMEDYRPTQKSLVSKNPHYKYILWNSSMIESLMDNCYPSVKPIYERHSGNPEILKNIASYAVVHNMGGVYLDMELACKQSLDELSNQLGGKTVALNYLESPLGISNKFFMATKDHEFMAHVLDGLENADVFYLAPFVKSTLSTGSVFLLGRYLNYPHKDEVYLLPSHSEYVERVVFRDPWYAIDGHFIAIVWKGVNPVQLFCIILMIIFTLRITHLLRIRRKLYNKISRKRVKRFYQSSKYTIPEI